MTRYYFNLRRDDTVFEDRAVIVLPDVTEAWRWAIRDALSLIQQGWLDRSTHRYWIEICDAERRSVVSVPIGRMTMQ